jgi:hypothetical protein
MLKKKEYLIALGLLLCTLTIQGRPFQREISYEIATGQSLLDIVSLQIKPALLRQTKFVINTNWLSIISTYPQIPRCERDYEYQMGQSVTEEYHNLPNKERSKDFGVRDKLPCATHPLIRIEYTSHMQVRSNTEISYKKWRQSIWFLCKTNLGGFSPLHIKCACW